MNHAELKTYPILNTTYHKIELKTEYGRVVISDLGATILEITVPDAFGNLANVVVSYSDFEDYIDDQFYLGSTIGRVAGRIHTGRLPVGENIYQLPVNDPAGNHLHGGFAGFNTKHFRIVRLDSNKERAVAELAYTSRDMEEGYPGTVSLNVTYIFAGNKLSVLYSATTDKSTPVNLTNHTYFNLTGTQSNATGQILTISSSFIAETDTTYIPTGKLVPVMRTPYDFREAKMIRFAKDQIAAPGFNEFYLLDQGAGPQLLMRDPESGRMLTIHTSYPGILFYTGDYLAGKLGSCAGVCFEPQHFPDAVNKPGFPSIILTPGNVYRESIEYTFSVGGTNPLI